MRGTDPQAGVLGDVLIAVNGQDVDELTDLTEAVERLGIGQQVTLTVRPGGQTLDIPVRIKDIGAR